MGLHFNKKKWGLDENVWIAMFSVCFICIILVGYKRATDLPCRSFEIVISGTTNGKNHSYVVDQLLTFSTLGADIRNEDITWNFGDKTKRVKGRHALHSFSGEGSFTVTAIINGKCESTVNVFAGKPFPVPAIDAPGEAAAIIAGNFSPLENTTVTYVANARAKDYEWTILDKVEYRKQTGKMAHFAFRSPGRYIIQLMLDNDPKKVYMRSINAIADTRPVSRRPSPTTDFTFPPLQQTGKDEAPKTDTTGPPAPKPKVPDPATPVEPEELPCLETSDKYLLKELQGVINGSSKMSDFDRILCNGLGTTVLINGKDPQPFSKFFRTVAGNNKRRIDGVEAVRENRRITLLKVAVKKKILLGWVDL